VTIEVTLYGKMEDGQVQQNCTSEGRSVRCSYFGKW